MTFIMNQIKLVTGKTLAVRKLLAMHISSKHHGIYEIMSM